MNLIQLSVEVHQVGPEKSQTPDEEFQNLFDDGIGQLPVNYKMKIGSIFTPVVKARRKTPITMKIAVKEELERIEKLSVIEQVDEPTQWVSSVVVVKKRVEISGLVLIRGTSITEATSSNENHVTSDIPKPKFFSANVIEGFVKY